MNTERENGRQDPLVSATYRELATESTPAHLDDKVLQHAARSRRTRYALAYAWMRPVAWAATIGLSLALVLELAQVPQAPEPVYMPEVPAPARLESLPELDLDGAIERKREMMAPAAEKTRQKPVTTDAASSHQDDGVPDEALEERAAASRLSPEFTGAASQAAATAAVHDEEPVCPAETRATAEDWFACITELELAGDKEIVEREFRLFVAAYPDFEAPARK